MLLAGSSQLRSVRPLLLDLLFDRHPTPRGARTGHRLSQGIWTLNQTLRKFGGPRILTYLESTRSYLGKWIQVWYHTCFYGVMSLGQVGSRYSGSLWITCRSPSLGIRDIPLNKKRRHMTDGAYGAENISCCFRSWGPEFRERRRRTRATLTDTGSMVPCFNTV